MAGSDAPRRLIVVYNPAAGGMRPKRFERILAALRGLGVVVRVLETAAPGDAERLAQAAADADCDAVAAAGGDGTVNDVANGLVGSDKPMAILPIGTVNVLADELGFPRDPAALARIAAFGPVRALVPGEVAGRRFVMMAGAGFDAMVVAGVNLALKRRIGRLAYAWACLRHLARIGGDAFEVTVDGQSWRAASVIASIGRNYAGRFVLVPEARFGAGELHVVLFLRGGRAAALRYLAALPLGRLHRRPDVTMLKAREVRIAGPPGRPIQADGDIVATVPASIRLGARPLRLIVPPG